MAARPAIAAFGCLQCRSYALKATTAAVSTPLLRTAALFQAPRFQPLVTRNPFSVASQNKSFEGTHDRVQKDAVSEADADEQPSEVTSSSEDVAAPWYLQVEPPRHPPKEHVSALPSLPESPPDILEPLMKYVYEEMGLDDLALLDLRDLVPQPALGPNLMMLFGTARSERHLHVASGQFVRWLLKNYRVDASADGLIGPGELRTKLRRMRRRAKLLGTNPTMAIGEDDGITTGWICVNLGTIGLSTGETTSIDEEGKVSGFGTSITGTTIVVQVMTEARRAELSLERLWTGQLTRSRAQEQGLQDDAATFSSRFGQLPPSKYPPLEKGGRGSQQQRRSISTSSRLSSIASGIPPRVSDQSDHDMLSEARKRIHEIRWAGAQVKQEECVQLLGAIFRASSLADDHAHNQAELSAKLLETMFERGLPILNHETLITMIESIVYSGTSNKAIQDIQSNLEFVLLRGVRSCPNESHLLRLLDAYAAQGNWEQFWETWRVPPRYLVRRSPVLYRFVYQRMAELGNQVQCIDTLRTCVPEMLREEPPVPPVGPVYEALKACVRVADPGAEGLAQNLVLNLGTDDPRSRKIANREFVKMLRQLAILRQ